MYARAILPRWAKLEYPERPKIKEGDFTEEQLHALNQLHYNIHNLPNHPSVLPKDRPVDGQDIDVFQYAYVDMDLKDGVWASNDSFIEHLAALPLKPSRVINSGHGIHAYWRIVDLDPMSYLRLQRRLCRLLKTDQTMAKIFQLMRPPGYLNTKAPDAFLEVIELYRGDDTYTCEQLDRWLPRISKEDEDYCQKHYQDTYNADRQMEVQDKLPAKFGQLLRNNKEVKAIFTGAVDDRSKADYRLGHLLFAEGYTRDEAASVLVNVPKAATRAPSHRVNYALNIIDKIWVMEETTSTEHLSSSVADILKRSGGSKGTRFPCWDVYDGTEHGFHLTEVLGLIGGAGSGKTTLALNYFYHFTKRNPEYIHLFVSLEQPEMEIANRWVRLVEANTALHDKVHVLGNYAADGTFRNLSLTDISNYIIELEARTKSKVGCVVIDHIGCLKMVGKDGEFQGLIDICHSMKAFAVRTNTFLVMQSQTSRSKSGIGDMELDKDAAYGTTMFEWYCDYVVTTWQPLKRIYSEATHMPCSAFKYCKIRHKNVKKDRTKEDAVHALMFDTDTERLRQMTQAEEEAYNHYNGICNTLRNKDRKREPTKITKIDWAAKEE